MISIIIPLYNKENSIKGTLQSVLTQDYENFEVIIVNDGSTDNSVNIINSFNDSRIHLVEQINGGPSKARNTGVKNAKGEWIVFLDADDELLTGALKNFVNLANSYPSILMFGCSYIKNYGKVKREPYHIKEGLYNNCYKTYCLNRYNYRTGSTMISKEIALKCPFNEKLRRFEDIDCFTRMHKYGGMYISSFIALQQNLQYCQACKEHKDISTDFVGHLDFRGKSFWETMFLYKLFIEERNHYPKQCKKLYSSIYYRVDLYLLYKIITKI